jgi:hypothetical protein
LGGGTGAEGVTAEEKRVMMRNVGVEMEWDEEEGVWEK